MLAGKSRMPLESRMVTLLFAKETWAILFSLLTVAMRISLLLSLSFLSSIAMPSAPLRLVL
jgi:hypothetical protein